MKIHAQYDASAPFDGNVEYGMANAYTLVQALQAAGKNLTRQALVSAVNNDGKSWSGPGLVPFRYTTTVHGGYGGVEMGQVRGGKIVLFGGPHDHRSDGRQPDHAVHRYPAGAAGEWNSRQLTVRAAGRRPRWAPSRASGGTQPRPTW